MLKTLFFTAVLGGSGIVFLSLGTAAKEKPAAPRFSNPTAITNKYLPLASLKEDILEGTEDGKSIRVERTMKPGTKEFSIGGQTIQAAIMEDREIIDGELEEVTLDYFAQADDGTVYYLGEDVDNYKSGKVVAHEGAWLYGANTKHLGTIITGNPTVGQKFRSEDVPRVTWEENTIESLSESITVPAGTYTGCVKIKELLSDGKTEYKFYAPGVGVVSETGKNVNLTLRSHQEK